MPSWKFLKPVIDPMHIFTPEQLASLDKTRLPNHVAIIPDGNRRWAAKKREESEKGHFQGASTLIEIVKAAKALGIKTITFFCFSTENWSRSREEINILMWLLQDFLNENRLDMQTTGVRFSTIGNLEALPQEALIAIEETRRATAQCQDINMVVALNYGARDEIRRVLHKIIDDSNDGKIHKEQITEALIASYLDTAPWGDPELFIRTSGEMRLSNYLLWQMAYTEIYFTDVLWPDFKPADLLAAVADFQGRERRWGGP